MEVRDWDTTRLVDGLRTPLEQTWNFASEALGGLTDEEYFWEPAGGCWNVRRRVEARTELVWGKGDWVVENAWQPPSPPPVTTIAWRLMHGYDCLLDFVARGLHMGKQSWNDIEVAGDATAAVEMLGSLVSRLDGELASRVDEDLHCSAENMDKRRSMKSSSASAKRRTTGGRPACFAISIASGIEGCRSRTSGLRLRAPVHAEGP